MYFLQKAVFMGMVSSIYNFATLFPKVLPDSCSFERVFSSGENYRMYSIVVKTLLNNVSVQPKTIMFLAEYYRNITFPIQED